MECSQNSHKIWELSQGSSTIPNVELRGKSCWSFKTPKISEKPQIVRGQLLGNPNLGISPDFFGILNKSYPKLQPEPEMQEKSGILGGSGNVPEGLAPQSFPIPQNLGNPGDIPKKTPIFGDFWHQPKPPGTRARPSSFTAQKEIKTEIKIISGHLRRNLCAHTWKINPTPGLFNPREEIFGNKIRILQNQPQKETPPKWVEFLDFPSPVPQVLAPPRNPAPSRVQVFKAA